MTSPLPGLRVQPAAPATAPSRRSFLRYSGASAVLGSLWLASCAKKEDPAPVAILPVITSFTPTSGLPGATVTLTGSALTGATAVTIGTVATTFTVVSATSLTFTVPATAQTGPITVTTPAGSATSGTLFTVTASFVSVGTGDVGVLNYAYALEQLEAAFYTQVRTGTYYTGLASTSAERLALDDLYYHEVIHREFLKSAIQGAGGTPLIDLKVDFTSINFNDRTSVLSTARAFEDLGSAAYIGAGQYISSPAFLYIAGKIASVEARHAALIRDFISENTFVGNDVVTLSTAGTSTVAANNGPAGSSLERALAPVEVVAVANTYLAVGSKLDVSGIR